MDEKLELGQSADSCCCYCSDGLCCERPVKLNGYYTNINEDMLFLEKYVKNKIMGEIKSYVDNYVADEHNIIPKQYYLYHNKYSYIGDENAIKIQRETKYIFYDKFMNHIQDNIKNTHAVILNKIYEDLMEEHKQFEKYKKLFSSELKTYIDELLNLVVNFDNISLAKKIYGSMAYFDDNTFSKYSIYLEYGEWVKKYSEKDEEDGKDDLDTYFTLHNDLLFALRKKNNICRTFVIPPEDDEKKLITIFEEFGSETINWNSGIERKNYFIEKWYINLKINIEEINIIMSKLHNHIFDNQRVLCIDSINGKIKNIISNNRSCAKMLFETFIWGGGILTIASSLYYLKTLFG